MVSAGSFIAINQCCSHDLSTIINVFGVNQNSAERGYELVQVLHSAFLRLIQEREKLRSKQIIRGSYHPVALIYAERLVVRVAWQRTGKAFS